MHNACHGSVIHNAQNKGSVASSSSAAFVGKKIKHSLSHQRFGHPTNEVIKLILDKAKIPSSVDSDDTICEPCLLGKFHKLPFSSTQSRSSSPFELVHTDVWGPSPFLSIDGYRYFVLFIDDCTRFTWMFPMKKKNEVLSFFKSLCAIVSTQFNKSIKTLRSDGGGEYMSLLFQNFLNEKGILHQVSCPYTPEQNGVSERKNRHVRETAVTLLQHASLPDQFWYHACATATFLINRMPPSVLNHKSPFESLYNAIHKIDMLRVFGCTCFPLLALYRSNKLQPKTLKCVFIGFAAGYKGFVCYNPTSRKYIVSRHVFFDETSFPYAVDKVKTSPSSTSSNQSQQNIRSSCLLQTQSQVLPSPVQVTSLIQSHTSGQASHLSTFDTVQVDSVAGNNQPDSHIGAQDLFEPLSVSQHCDFVDNDLVLHFSPGPSISQILFSPQTDTTVQFEENNGTISLSSAPGDGNISVVLHSDQQPTTTSISEANILHPIQGFSNAPVNDHSMVTRAKRRISKKKML